MSIQEEISIRFTQLFNALKESGEFNSNSDLASKLGYTPQKLNEILKGRTKFNLDFLQKFCNLFDISLDYIVFGIEKPNRQNMLHDESVTKSVTKSVTNQKDKKSYTNNEVNEPSLDIQKFPLRTDIIDESQYIPLYDIEAVAGIVPLFTDTANQKPIDYIHIPNLPRCDGSVYVTGDSMYPLLKSGDIVAFKTIEDFDNDIYFGQMYILSIDMAGDEITTIKYIQKSDKEGYIRLVSQNQHHQEKDVKLSKIRALGLVRASIRVN